MGAVGLFFVFLLFVFVLGLVFGFLLKHWLDTRNAAAAVPVMRDWRGPVASESRL